jgi:flagellar hook-associated protein 2
MDLSVSGLASGFDWKSTVDQLTQVERAPQKRMRADQQTLQRRNAAYGNIQTQMATLLTKVKALNDPTFFDARSATPSDSTVATATAAAGAAVGSYKFNITQLATSSQLRGASDSGASLSPMNDVSSLVLANAGFSTAVSAGTFTVNGKQVTVATTDTLQQVFDKISTATGGIVTGSYDAASDKITLASVDSSTVILGASNDTSNFLGVARLNNNGGSSITSSMKLGSILTSAALVSGNFATPVTDGGAGAGQFKINGVAISYNASTDTTNDIIARINSSSAGVTASYDATTDSLMLSNNNTGDLGIALQDVTGNFLAAAGLKTGSTLTRGLDLQYTLNDGATVLTSKSNTLDEVSSGVAGLNVTALKLGTVTVQVGTDTSGIKQGITDFITEYNRSQAMIDSYTASSTDAQGKVTAGVLAGESDAGSIATRLRSLVMGQVTGLTGSIDYLSKLGIDSNGNDNSISLTDSSKLDAALASNPAAVKEFFTNKSTGLAKQLYDYVNKTAGDDGDLTGKQQRLGTQITDIDTQVADQERYVQSVRAQLIASFTAMETAQSQINQQMQFINQKFGVA